MAGDLALEDWARKNNIVLLKTEDNNKNLLVFYQAFEKNCIQAVLERKTDKLNVDVWPVELEGFDDAHAHFVIKPSITEEFLTKLVAQMQLWLKQPRKFGEFDNIQYYQSPELGKG